VLTRKEFLQTLAGAALVPVLGSASAAPDATPSISPGAPRTRMGRGVTFYSYQDELVTHRMNIEDCVAAVADLGTDGIEMVGEEGVPNFPNPPQKFVADWHGWMRTYGTRPICYDCVYDSNLYSSRSLTLKESTDIIVRDLKIANRLGFKIMRAQRTIPADVIENVIPYAEKLDIKMGIEIHAPVLLKSAWMDPFMEVIHKTNTRNFGFVVDMGIFVQRPPRVQREYWMRRGAQDSVADHVDQSYGAHVPKETVLADLSKLGGNDADKAWVNGAYSYSNNDPADLLKFPELIFHCHAKFYEMTDELQEYSIDYPKIIEVLKRANFTGYLCSEYEGQRHINDAFESNAVEQVRRQHVMLSKLIGEA
jgi:sugar phosphate isomerase/epimerase